MYFKEGELYVLLSDEIIYFMVKLTSDEQKEERTVEGSEEERTKAENPE